MRSESLVLGATALLFGFMAIGNVNAGWGEAARAYKAGDYAVAISELDALTKTEHATDAFYYLAKMYAEGKGVTRDMAKALQLYYQAAKLGDIRSAVELGSLYYSGRDLIQNIPLAKQWFEYAANKGNPVAQYNLGIIYENGTGVTADSRMAFNYYQRAANTGYVLAQKKVGLMLYEGKGVPQDYNLALQYLTRAADQGDIDAQVTLARLLSNTKMRGAPINLGLAYKWYNIAAAYADDDMRNTLVKERDALSRKMPGELILAAQQAASSWKPKVIYAVNTGDEIVVEMQANQDKNGNNTADKQQENKNESSSISSFLDGLFTSDKNKQNKSNTGTKSNKTDTRSGPSL